MKKTKQLQEKHKQFVRMLGEGLTAREISQQIGISEKTLSQWRHKLPQAVYAKLAKAVRERLQDAIEKPETTHTDVYNLTNSLVKLEQLAQLK